MNLSIRQLVNPSTIHTMKKWTLSLGILFALPTMLFAQTHQWTLKDCISHAMQHNISLQKQRIAVKSAEEEMLHSKAELLPSVSASTSQNVNYRPWPETGAARVANGSVQSSVDKVFYNGTYVINAQWTLWNGNRNRNTIALNQLQMNKAEAEAMVSAATIQERIAQLYVQILYSAEAINVSKQALETSARNEERGKEMLNVGKMSKADLAQLTAQRAQEEYNVLSAQSTLADFKRQLKQLLQITDSAPFEVAVPATTDDMALQSIPSVSEVYAQAISWRPELKAAQLAINGAETSIKVAKAQNLPTLSLGASMGTNTTSMSNNAWGTQIKTNFDMGAGLTLSIPLFDNRNKRTAVNRAQFERQSSMLDLQDKQTALYSNIEECWLQATNNQNKYKAAKVSVESAQQSYDLLNEQFNLGLKNIIELMTGKNNLVTAQQNELQSKYMAILNIHLLNFYKTGEIK